MGRANAIVVGSAVLAPLILGVEGFALFRPHHRPPPPAEMADLPAAVVPLAAPAAPVVPRSAERVPAPPPAPPPEAPEEPPAALEPVEAPPDPATLARQRELLARQRQVVRDADEKAFDVLNLPDPQRAAIRAINDQYVRALQSMEPSGTTADSAGTVADLNANQTRRAAITEVLGADAMHAFTNQERRAERRVRGELRAQSLRGQ